MEKEFEILEHTADVGIIAYGSDMKEAFANTAKGMFSLITELEDVEEVEYWETELTAPDRESLLVDWLNELIYLFDVENILFNRFDITRLNDIRLKARSYGQKVDSSRHELKLGIKAATYHMLKIERSENIRVQVLFDI
ncbi:archease [Chloroflexota bacterium]